MPCGPGKRIGTAVFFMAVALTGQQPTGPAAPAFEVVSIRAVPANAPMIVREQDFTPILPGGRYIDSSTPLLFMIDFAYNVKYYFQLVGLPNWAKFQSYSVAAKPAEGFPALSTAENREQVRLMMRAMLADRFHLQLHTETRQERVYKLEVAKGGMRIKEVDPPVPPAKEGNVGAAMRNDGGIRMIANKSTMADLARCLTLLMGRPVIDETGITAYYDFDVKWSGPELRDGQAPETQFGGPELVGLLISNLQNQFGLRVTSTTGPVEYWIIDHVDAPTEN